MPNFEKVRYSDLNARQQEVFNFQWISGALATYGYHTHLVPTTGKARTSSPGTW